MFVFFSSLFTNVCSCQSIILPLLNVFTDKPPPCNFYYLSDCKHGLKCRYGHNYILLPEHLEELRLNSKKWPCPYLNKSSYLIVSCPSFLPTLFAIDSPCPHNEQCCMSHICPKGRKCTFLKQGRCKFTGSESFLLNVCCLLLTCRRHSKEHMHDHEGTATRKGTSSSVAPSSSDSPAVSEVGLPPWDPANYKWP